MLLTVTLNCTKIAMVSQANPNTNYSGQASYDLTPENGDNQLYLAFDALPANLRNHPISSVKLVCKNVTRQGFSTVGASLRIDGCDTAFTENAVTWNNRPEKTTPFVWGFYLSSGTNNYTEYLPSDSSFTNAKWLTIPTIRIDPFAIGYEVSVSGAYADYSLEVTYDPDSTTLCTVKANAMNGIYVNPRLGRWMTWTLGISTYTDSYNSALGFTQVSAVFFWREGTSGAFTQISIPNSTQRVDIPANTFPVQSSCQYYVEVVNNFNDTIDSSVYSFSTTDAEILATPIAPLNTIEDCNDMVVFRWDISSPNGTAPTGADLEGSSNGSTWVSFGTISGAANSFAAPANTFTAGTRYWRVRIYNADSVAGSWSAAASFVSVGAPAAPAVSINAVPFATISWDAEGQQAYRITVDGKISGPFFGTGKSFTLPDYLADGEHTVSVEVQGQYGLWSQPGTVSFTVANVPGDAVTLQGSFDVDAALEWISSDATADFLIYRDGVKIGHTTGYVFTDRLALGEHSYQVLNRLPGGYYTLSNAVSGVLQSEITRVALFSGGAWLQLPLSERSSSEQRFDYSRSYSLRHMMGAALPVLELSPYEDGSGTYEAAFRNAAEAQAFAQLRGKLVIIKSRRGEILVGALTRVTTRQTNFYTAVEFIVQRCHYEDYVDDENS